MFNLNGWEFIILALLALFIFGPERLPKAIGEAIRILRGLRQMARNATSDLSRELGTEVTLEDLHPKTFIRKHVFSDEDQATLRRPLDDLARELNGLNTDVRRSLDAPAPEERKGRTPRTDPDAT